MIKIVPLKKTMKQEFDSLYKKIGFIENMLLEELESQRNILPSNNEVLNRNRNLTVQQLSGVLEGLRQFKDFTKSSSKLVSSKQV